MAVDFKKLGKNLGKNLGKKDAKGTTKGKGAPPEKKAPPVREAKGKDFDDTNRFVLFQNDKDGNEARPDYTGNITLADGSKLRLAGWLSHSEKVGDFISGKVSEFEEK